jgi:hypothetical protein
MALSARAYRRPPTLRSPPHTQLRGHDER